MAIFKDTVMVKDRPFNRAVKVIVTAPDDANPNLQDLAERARRTVGRKITIGNVTVRVEPFRR
jgi:hypothetical protein